MAFISGLTLKLCAVSNVLWFQNCNAHTLIKDCYILWLIIATLTSLNTNIYFTNYPVSSFWPEIIYMQLLDDAIFLISQPCEDNSGINWKSNVSSYFFCENFFPPSYSFRAVQCQSNHGEIILPWLPSWPCHFWHHVNWFTEVEWPFYEIHCYKHNTKTSFSAILSCETLDFGQELSVYVDGIRKGKGNWIAS